MKPGPNQVTDAAKLEQAVSELMLVSDETIDRGGKSLEDLRKGLVEL